MSILWNNAKPCWKMYSLQSIQAFITHPDRQECWLLRSDQRSEDAWHLSCWQLTEPLQLLGTWYVWHLELHFLHSFGLPFSADQIFFSEKTQSIPVSWCFSKFIAWMKWVSLLIWNDFSALYTTCTRCPHSHNLWWCSDTL